jgi:flagellar basal-body rod protein FlgG
VFEDLMYQNLRQVGANTSEQSTCPPACTWAWACARWPPAVFSQGNLQQTSNNLDVAMQGNGFFQVTMPDGTIGYTRDGSFQVTTRAAW